MIIQPFRWIKNLFSPQSANYGMILSDGDILSALESGELEIAPFIRENLNPNSYDVTLSGVGVEGLFATNRIDGAFAYPGVIDPKDKRSFYYDHFDFDRDGKLRLQPNQVYIASVNERTKFGRHTCGQLQGKSSLARLGLAVHITAGWADSGWNGVYVLELVNHNQTPFMLHKNMKIAQIVFSRTQNVLEAYNEKSTSKYRDQKAGQGSLYHLNYEEPPC